MCGCNGVADRVGYSHIDIDTERHTAIILRDSVH